MEAQADIVRADEKGQTALHKVEKEVRMNKNCNCVQACTLDTPILVKLIIKTVEDKFGHHGVLDILAQEDDDMNTPLFISVESGSYASAKV